MSATFQALRYNMIKNNENQLVICVFQNNYCLNPDETEKFLEWNQTILEF